MTTYYGLSFPFRRGPTGFPESATDDDLLWESVVQLIETGAGERVMRGDAGSLVLSLLFENDSETLGALVAADLSQLIARYESRVLLRSVLVSEVDREEGSLTLDLEIINRATGAVIRRSTTLGAT